MRHKNLIKMFYDTAKEHSDKTALLFKESGQYVNISYKEL